MYGYSMCQFTLTRIKTYKPGRRCKECQKPLSMYNKGPYCFACQERREEEALEALLRIPEQLPIEAEPKTIRQFVLARWGRISDFLAEAGWKDSKWQALLEGWYQPSTRAHLIEEINRLAEADDASDCC